MIERARRRPAGPVARLLGTVGVAAWLGLLSSAVAATIPGGTADQWLGELPAEAVPVALALRLAVAGTAACLVATTALAVAGELAHATRRSWAGWGPLSPPAFVTRLAATAVGTSLAVTLVAPSAHSAAGPAPRGAVEVPVEEPGTREVAVLAHEGPVDAGADRGAAPDEWQVRAGDHLWRVAEQTLLATWGRAPTDAEVAPYWREVVAANRARLVDPANPDLVLPGQVLVVPAPPRPR